MIDEIIERILDIQHIELLWKTYVGMLSLVTELMIASKTLLSGRHKYVSDVCLYDGFREGPEPEGSLAKAALPRSLLMRDRPLSELSSWRPRRFTRRATSGRRNDNKMSAVKRVHAAVTKIALGKFATVEL